MTDVPTPRTDELVFGQYKAADGPASVGVTYLHYQLMVNLARTLEREIAQQAARIDALTKALRNAKGDLIYVQAYVTADTHLGKQLSQAIDDARAALKE